MQNIDEEKQAKLSYWNFGTSIRQRQALITNKKNPCHDLELVGETKESQLQFIQKKN